MTMLSLRKAQSTLLVKLFADTGNLVAAAVVCRPIHQRTAVLIIGVICRCHYLVRFDGGRAFRCGKGTAVMDQPLIGVFVMGGAALLFGFVVLTLDWYARRNQQRKK